MSKMREDEIERRIENRAAILDEYQPSFRQTSWLEALRYSEPGAADCPDEDAAQRTEEDDEYRDYFQQMDRVQADPGLMGSEKIYIKIVAMRLQTESKLVARQMLLETAYWSPGYYEELARISPVASARLNMILARAYHDERGEPESPFQAVEGRRAKVVVEIRKRRYGVLYLPSLV